jgi:tetratricopeptide (TPR) repeat protein
MQKRIILIIFCLFLLSGLGPGEAKEKVESASELYDSAIELYHRGSHEEAVQRFSKIVQSFSESRLVPYSRYMIGLCSLKMARYEEAAGAFERYLKAYPEGDRASEAAKRLQEIRELGEKTSPPPISPKSDTRLQPDSPRLIIPTAEQKPAPVKRRVCAQIRSFEVQSMQELEKKVKQLKEVGVNTLILRVFQNKGERSYKFVNSQVEEGVYFKTDCAPVIQDILGPVTEIARRHGVEVFAWMTTRYAGYGLDRPEYRCRSYNFEKRRFEESKGSNLFHPNVVTHLEGLFRDLGRYPIEGILFQDDLILKHNEDFSPEANKAFSKEFGFSPSPDRFYVDPYRSESGKYYVRAYTGDFWSWANWKNRWLMKIAERLMGAARQTNPDLQFAINLYYESVLNPNNGVAWFSQTLAQALEKNFDYYAIMSYHRQTMKERKIEGNQAIHLMAEVAQKAVQSVGDPSRVMMKFQIYDWKTFEVVPSKEVEQLMGEILKNGAVSLAFYPYIGQFPLSSLKKFIFQSQ